MATATYSSFDHKPLYDIHRNDFANQNYQVSINGGLDMGSEESLYPQSLNEAQGPVSPHPPFQQPNDLSYYQSLQMGFTPTFATNGVTYFGGMAPNLQPYSGLHDFQTTVPSFTTLPSLASSSSTLPRYPLTTSPILSRKVKKANPASKLRRKYIKRNSTQSVMGKLLISKPKRQRGPNKRPPGTAFSSLLDGLPTDVREALEKDYIGCCESVNIKDASTKQKHMFSNRHCKNLPLEYQKHVPSFVCPAFVALKDNCRSKAGRYDSTDRHCKNCPGFLNISKGKRSACPVVITREQYNSIQHYRTTHGDSEGEKQPTDQSTDQSDVQIRTVLAEVFRDGLPDWFPAINLGDETSDSGAIKNDTAQLPTNTTSAVVPVASSSSFELPSLHEPSLFDPDSTNGCGLSEALKNGFPTIRFEGESSDCGAVMDASSQLSAISVPVSAPNHSTQPPRYEPSLFDPLSAFECAEALTDGFPVINIQGESNVTVAPSQSSMSLPVTVPVGAQSEFLEPSLFDPESVDEWAFLTDFSWC